MNFKINNNTGSPIHYEKEIHSLCDFAQKRLGFKKPPNIFLNHDERNASNTLSKTGHYDPNTMEIHVFATGRHPKDILRSISHELVHHAQHMRGDLDMEGYSGKGYAQKNPKLRKAEIEANDPMLFRDWEDSIKEKENTIYNERRNRKMSIKDWKNNELSENLNKKWGFKMDLGKLTEAKKPDADGDGVPDWADKKPGEDDHAEKGDEEGDEDNQTSEKSEEGEGEKSEDKPEKKPKKKGKGKIPDGLKRYMDNKKKGKK